MNSIKKKYGRTFPLHLPPIDWFFLCDDTIQYPMVYYIELEFSGQIDRDLFDGALQQALERHPLLFAIVQPAKQNKPCWVLAPEQMPTIDWADESAPIEFPDGEFMDIRNKTGLRIWGRQSDDRTRLTMQLHHAVTDGTGAYRFIGDLIACYMQRIGIGEDKVQLGVFDPAQLKLRTSKMRSIRFADKPLHKLGLALSEGRKQFLHRFTPLRTPASRPTEVSLPGIVNQEFSSEQVGAIRKSATDRGGTMNDWLLCKMLQTALAWNGKRSRKPFRILVPSDMRDGADFEIPACNMTAYTFVTASPKELADEEKLLERIAEETREIKSGDRQKNFVNGLTTAMTVPFLLPMILKRNVCLATSVLSNAGDPSRRFTCRVPKKRGKVSCDAFTLESISGVPPLRRETHCTLSSSSYGRKLTFSMRCNPHYFAIDDTRELLNLFCDQVRTLIR